MNSKPCGSLGSVGSISCRRRTCNSVRVWTWWWRWDCTCVPLSLLTIFFLLDAAWVRSRAERPSVSYTKVTSKVAWTSHNLQVTNKLKQQNCGSNKFRKKGGDGKMKRMLEPSIKLIGEVHRMKMSGVRIQMQRRASNSSARRIEKAESKMCVCPPARRTRSTEVMKKGGWGETQPTSNLKGRPKIKMHCARM